MFKFKHYNNESGKWFVLDLVHRSYHILLKPGCICFGIYNLDIGEKVKIYCVTLVVE